MLREPPPWQVESEASYVPVSFRGVVVGFFQQIHATQITNILNDEERYRKALKLVCWEIVRRSGGDEVAAEALVEQYVAKVSRPRSGTGAIALMLRERQGELDLGMEEFAHFCESFRLSQESLQEIFLGKPVSDRLLGPLARILGTTVERLVAIRGTDTESSD